MQSLENTKHPKPHEKHGSTRKTPIEKTHCREVEKFMMKWKILLQIKHIPENSTLEGNIHVQLFSRIQTFNVCIRKQCEIIRSNRMVTRVTPKTPAL